MADRQMHVTSYLYGETPAAIFRFLEAACHVPYLREVIPVRRDDGQVIAAVFMTIDEGDSDIVMPAVVRHLSGILGREIELAAARESAQAAAASRRRSWVIPGRTSEVRRGEVVSGMLELEVSTDG